MRSSLWLERVFLLNDLPRCFPRPFSTSISSLNYLEYLFFFLALLHFYPRENNSMKTVLLSLFLAVLSLTNSHSQQTLLPPTSVRPKAKSFTVDPSTRSNVLARTGGIVQKIIAGPSILLLNTQNRVSASEVHEVSDQIQKSLRLPCKIRTELSGSPIRDAMLALNDTNTAVVIVIGQMPDYPSLLLAPEARWGMVNVVALDKPGTSNEVISARVQKEIWRAFGLLMGSANSLYEHCLLKPVFSTADLDALPAKTICPESYGKILSQAQRMGMNPIHITTYRKAVEEGWASPPTNDNQRAIWKELKK